MSKIIDEKGRLFGKISIIDIIVIIIAIVLVVAVYVKFGKNSSANLTETHEVTYTMEVNGIREGTADAVRVGDKLYDYEHKVYIGEITDIQEKPATAVIQDLSGNYKETDVAGRYYLLLTLRADCEVVDGRVYSQGTQEITVNANQRCYSKYATFSGKIMKIDYGE